MNDDATKKLTESLLVFASAQNNVADEMRALSANLVKFMGSFTEHLKALRPQASPAAKENLDKPLSDIAAALDRQTKEMGKDHKAESKKVKIAIRHSDGSASLITEE